jgi:CubicO group peptidase (beta-lactamase class C family)
MTIRLDEKAVGALRARVMREINAGHIPSAQLALAMDGEVVWSETLGDAPADARYIMMSSTKSVFAALVLQLLGEGELDLDKRVVEWWPEFGKHGKDVITLEQVMTFTAGIPNRAPTFGADREQRRLEIEDWTLETAPGSQYGYHAVSAHWILAELVERVTGRDYRVALRERILDPLGLTRLELGVPEDRQHDVQRLTSGGDPATIDEIRDFFRRHLGLELPDGAGIPLLSTPSQPANAPDLVPLLDSSRAMAYGVPAGGAVADAVSVARFYQALLRNDQGLWDPKVLDDAKTNARNTLPTPFGEPASRSIAFEIAQDDRRGPAGRFGHPGAMGQMSWAHPATGLSFCFLTNGGDRNFVRAYDREFELSRLAGACIQG